MKNTETITLQIKKNRYRSFLLMLRKYDFIRIEKPEDILSRYVSTAPLNIPISDNDIIEEMMKKRWVNK